MEIEQKKLKEENKKKMEELIKQKDSEYKKKMEELKRSQENELQLKLDALQKENELKHELNEVQKKKMEEDLRTQFQAEYKKQSDLLIQQAKEEKIKLEEEIKKVKTDKKKEIVDKLKDSRSKKVFVLEKSTKVIFDKFVNEYDKIVKDLFGDKNDDEHKIQNYEINIEEYKILLVNLGFMKNEIGENENNDLLIKNSFNNYLNPKEGKIETNKFLVFSLAALGIYKGRDEKIIEHCSNITPKFKPEEEKENEENNNNE